MTNRVFEYYYSNKIIPMYREQFVRENPELAAKQDKEWNISILRLIAIISLGVTIYVGTTKYCKDEDFRMKVNDIIEKINYEAMRQFG